jgi:DNA-binding response OmpR family regulator
MLTEHPARGRWRGGGLRPLALIVDSDSYQVKILSYILRENHFRFAAVSTAEAALDSLMKRRPDVILMDLLLPDMNGLELIARIRQVSSVPTLVMTALPETHTKVKALELGADDYLSKPFNYDELVARTKALVRRVALNLAECGEGALRVGDLRIDLERRKVSRKGVDLELGETHWRLLYCLVVRRGRAVRYDELLESVWPGQHYRLSYLRQCVSRLRRRIGDTEAHIIRNVPGQGYIIGGNGH